MPYPRVDVHHHFVPEFYRKLLIEGGGDPSGWTVPDWTLEQDAELCNAEGIGFSFLTLTAPGAEAVGPDSSSEQQAAFCRRVNEEAAAAVAAAAARPGPRYGFFATLPSPLLDGGAAARAEAAHALDVLGADGVILMTRYGNHGNHGNHGNQNQKNQNCYLGHAALRGLWEFLDERAAVVLVHPTHPADTAPVSAKLPQPMVDYAHETTRAAVDMIAAGTVRKCRHVKVILSHAGGTLPYLAMRPAAMLPHFKPPRREGEGEGEGEEEVEMTTESFMEDARSFYFDTALSAAPLTLELLRGFARPGHILYGSDYPYAPTPAIRRMNGMLTDFLRRDEALDRSVSFEAAVALFPRLAGILGVGVVLARATTADFLYAVLSTRIFCRPRCPSRRPRRANVRYFDNAAQARAAGFRPCLRCRPDEVEVEVEVEEAEEMPIPVAAACELMRQRGGALPLADAAAHVGLSPRYFHGLFKQVMRGTTPGAYAAQVRKRRARDAEAAAAAVGGLDQAAQQDVASGGGAAVQAAWDLDGGVAAPDEAYAPLTGEEEGEEEEEAWRSSIAAQDSFFDPVVSGYSVQPDEEYLGLFNYDEVGSWMWDTAALDTAGFDFDMDLAQQQTVEQVPATIDPSLLNYVLEF
ncbi:hypothetical protein GGR56DRAFT_692572 [Xylariaceae sp. FL0804]|nr:hypothetical protein GGR56DRAFT_692572 [Xylariaceae sp. FL0804]